MQVFLTRFLQDKYSTIGNFNIPNLAHCYILERAADGPHPRIPPGNYRMVLKSIGASRFDNGSKGADDIRHYMGDLHKGMIELVGVPGRSEILIHPANHSAELLGCLAPGTTFTQSTKGSGGVKPTYFVNNSRDAYKKIYPPIANAIMNGTRVSIMIVEAFAMEPLIA